MSTIETKNNEAYKFYENSTGFLEFQVQATSSAEIALTTASSDAKPMYEIFIGADNNTKTYLKKQQINVATVNTANILSSVEYRGFWIYWKDNKISFGKEGEVCPFITWADTINVPINVIGIRTSSSVTGSWKIQKGTWKAGSNGAVPPKAFIAGIGEEGTYIIRCPDNNALIPGKLVVLQGTAYIFSDGQEKGYQQYYVLCDFIGTWMRITKGTNIPKNAFVAGRTQSGEPLYVGRIVSGQQDMGSNTIGKVQSSTRECIISCKGKAIPYTTYEILVN